MVRGKPILSATWRVSSCDVRVCVVSVPSPRSAHFPVDRLLFHSVTIRLLSLGRNNAATPSDRIVLGIERAPLFQYYIFFKWGAAFERIFPDFVNQSLFLCFLRFTDQKDYAFRTWAGGPVFPLTTQPHFRRGIHSYHTPRSSADVEEARPSTGPPG